jgi:hypothetical protein
MHVVIREPRLAGDRNTSAGLHRETTQPGRQRELPSLMVQPLQQTTNTHKKKKSSSSLARCKQGSQPKKGTRTSPQPNSPPSKPSNIRTPKRQEKKPENYPIHASAGADSQIPTPSLHPLDSTTKTLTQPNPAQAAKTGKPRSKPTAACQRALTPSYLTKTSERSAH